MAITIEREKPPLSTDKDGVIRVGGTRVTLDIVVGTFNRGATAEEIADKYPSLSLADIYTVIGYYLRNRNDVESYLGERAKEAKRVREENEANHPNTLTRERLLARQMSSREN